MKMRNAIRLILTNCVLLGALRERRWHGSLEQNLSSLCPCCRLLTYKQGTLCHLAQPWQWELCEGKWSGGIFLLACKSLLTVKQPSRFTAGLVWLPTWSNRTLLQVLAFLAVSLPANSLIRHGYLAFHGYFLKASEVCFAACMDLVAGMGSEGGIPPRITVNQGQKEKCALLCT